MHAADFIETYPDIVDSATCAAIVRRMRDSDALQPGRDGSGVFPELKRSRDLSLVNRPEWRDIDLLLQQAVFAGLLRYLRQYTQALISQ